jgi:RecA/RadA recombinase
MEPIRLNHNNYGKFIKFHCAELNLIRMFPEGINNNQIIEVTGEAGSGKTGFCISMALNFLLSHKDKSVLYITTNQKFSRTRLNQIINYYSENSGYYQQDLFSRFLCQDLSFENYEDVTRDIEETVKKAKYGMIVIDTITGLAQFENFQEKTMTGYYEKKKFISDQFDMFKKLIRNYNMFIFLVNDVRTNLENNVNFIYVRP